MKANATTENRRGSTNGNDIVQNAINLGVKVQQINIFLKESNKYVNYLMFFSVCFVRTTPLTKGDATSSL
jgi:hypothetical protein